MTTSGDGDDRRTLKPRTQPPVYTAAPTAAAAAAAVDGVADSAKSASSDDDRLSGTDDSGSEDEIDPGTKETRTQAMYEGQTSEHPSTQDNAERGKGVRWSEDLSNLLTPQTVMEQAQVRRRKRNREAARRSRQRQKEREQQLVERQAQLSDRLRFLERELEEWRTINASSNSSSNKVLINPDTVASDSHDIELAENINNIYALTMDTLHVIGELQLQLDEITKELNSMIG